MNQRFLTLMVSLSITACSNASEPGPGARSAPSSHPVVVEQLAAAPFRESCEYFESLDFGRISATALRGHAWQGLAGEQSHPLAGVQIAARELRTGRIWHSHTQQDGSFEIPRLPPGEYEVWTCLDGFDESRFLLDVDPSSYVEGVDLFLAPSEAPGLRDVLPIEAASG